ncbi:MAG: type I restriction-modification system subunit M N-terminal domain-containing protein [Bacilli bacterium]|nr:type I restriction-modification system subunit M N-terminal domain-containing protein [Bacilli bacterium]
MAVDRDELLSKQQNEVDSKLWAMANNLRGNMDASEFKNYILGLIFYKFLSDKITKTINDELEDDGLTFKKAWKDASMQDDIRELATNVIGYFLEPQYLFDSFVEKINVNDFTVEDLKEGIKAIVNSTIGSESQDDFADLFDDMDLDDNKLGKGEAERSKLIGKIILQIRDLNLDISETNFDILGHAYEYLIGKFAASAGIHVFDKSIFPEDMDDYQILSEASDKVANLYKTLVNGGCIIRDNLVIYTGYTTDWKGE